MVKAHMTKLYWYDTEVRKLQAQGYAPVEAHRIVMDRFLNMDGVEWTPNNYNITVISEGRINMIKILKEWLDYWRNFLKGIVADDRYDVIDDASDSPIYDQLEREWSKKGKLPLTLRVY